MKNNMTSKERMLIAIKNGKADRVPVAPDISNIIPCKLTGKPFWEIYLQDPLSDGAGENLFARVEFSRRGFKDKVIVQPVSNFTIVTRS